MDDRQIFGRFFNHHLWDLLTDLDRQWLTNHMNIVIDMNHWIPPRDPYQSGIR